MATLLSVHYFQNTPTVQERRQSTTGPFRATQIWHNIIQDVHDKIIPKRHRHLVKTYENSFPGTEVADVLQNYLKENGNFTDDIPRNKAIKLAQLLLDANVFQEAVNQTEKKTVFCDNSSHFYRFLELDTKDRCHACNNRKRHSTVLESEGASSCKALCPCTKENLASQSEPARQAEILCNPAIDADHALRGSRRYLRRVPSKRKKCLKPRVIQHHTRASIWREATIHRLLMLVDVPVLDNLLSSDVSWPLNQENDVIGNVGVSLEQTFRDISKSPVDSWMSSAFSCLEHHPKGNVITTTCIENAVEPTTSKHARKLLLFDEIAKFYGTKKSPLMRKFVEVLPGIVALLVAGKQEMTIEVLQLCMLLLSNGCREQLKHLLNFMSNAGSREAVRLKFQMDNRSTVCHIFTSAIIQTCSLSPTQCSYVVGFMMDHHQQLFLVPEAMKASVDAKLKKWENGEDGLTEVHQFCTRISVKEFQDQCFSATELALKDLMNTIIDNTTLSLKEKKHRLKQLHKNHKYIYEKHFPDMLM